MSSTAFIEAFLEKFFEETEEQRMLRYVTILPSGGAYFDVAAYLCSKEGKEHLARLVRANRRLGLRPPKFL